MFNETVLKIERNEISAIDVAYYVDVLKGNIGVRKREKYLDPAIEEEFEILTNTDGFDFDEDTIFEVFDQFYGSYIVRNAN